MISFDFPKAVYEQLLGELTGPERDMISKALSRQPYKVVLGDDGPVMMIVGEIGDAIHTNDSESYRPFIAEEFVRDVTRDGESPSGGDTNQSDA